MKMNEVVREFIHEGEIRQYSKKTLKGYRNNLLYISRFLLEQYELENVEDVTPPMIKAFVNLQNQKHYKESYINGQLKVLHSFFKYLVKEEYIERDPMVKIGYLRDKIPLIKTFTDKEVSNMMNVYKGKDYMNVRNQAILAILFDTGIRNYELCTLTVANVKESYITILGKGKKERVVSVSPYLSRALFKYERMKQLHFEHRKTDEEYYFLSRSGKMLTVEAIERIVRNAGKVAKVSKTVRCSPHTCRHFFAQSQLKNGLEIYMVSRLLGHGNVQVTQRYLQGLKDNDILERSVKTSPLMNLKG